MLLQNPPLRQRPQGFVFRVQLLLLEDLLGWFRGPGLWLALGFGVVLRVMDKWLMYVCRQQQFAYVLSDCFEKRLSQVRSKSQHTMDNTHSAKLMIQGMLALVAVPEPYILIWPYSRVTAGCASVHVAHVPATCLTLG